MIYSDSRLNSNYSVFALPESSFLFNFDIPTTYRWSGIWGWWVGHPKPEMFTRFFILPTHLQHQGPIHFYGSLVTKRALLYAAATLPAFIWIHYNRWLFLHRIWQEHIHLASFHAEVTPRAYIFVKLDRFIRCNQVRNSINFLFLHVTPLEFVIGHNGLRNSPSKIPSNQ